LTHRSSTVYKKEFNKTYYEKSNNLFSFYFQPEHKIQSSGGPLNLSLQLVPKMLEPLVKEWVPNAFIVSFKVRTCTNMNLYFNYLVCTLVCSGGLHRNRQNQYHKHTYMLLLTVLVCYEHSIKKRMEDIKPVAITTKAVNLMEVRFLLSCEKHMIEGIISIRGEIWVHRTSLTLPLVTLMYQARTLLCICMLVVSLMSLFLQFPDYILELF